MLLVDVQSNPDELMRRLPAAAWRALPSAAVAGTALLAGWFAVTMTGGVWAILAQCVWIGAAGPLMAVVVDRVQRELWEASPNPLRVVVLVGVRVAAVPATFALLAVSGFAASELSGSAAFAIVGIAATLLGVVAALFALVVLPIALVRHDARLVSIWLVALFAVFRRPTPVLSSAAGIVALLSLSVAFAPAVMVAVPMAAAAFAVAAAWTSAGKAGVIMPRMTPSPGRAGARPGVSANGRRRGRSPRPTA